MTFDTRTFEIRTFEIRTFEIRTRVAEFWTIFEFQRTHQTTCSPMLGGYLVQI